MPGTNRRARRWPTAAALFTCLMMHAAGCDESSLHEGPPDRDVDNTPPVCGVTPDEVVFMDACGLGAPCLAAHFYGRQSGCGGPLEEGADDYAVDEYCALEHLSTGAPGRLPLRWECEGFAEDAAVYVLAPGEAMLVTRQTTPCTERCLCDSSAEYRALERCTLKEAAFFADCLEATTRSERLDCMNIENWFVGCAPDEPVCLP